MTTLSPELLARLDATDEVGLLTQGSDGATRGPVIVWVVRAGEHAYLRSVKGADGAWYRNATRTGRATVDVEGERTDVGLSAVPVSERELQDAIDAAYRAKYSRYGPGDLDPILTDRATATTLRLEAAGG